MDKKTLFAAALSGLVAGSIASASDSKPTKEKLKRKSSRQLEKAIERAGGSDQDKIPCYGVNTCKGTSKVKARVPVKGIKNSYVHIQNRAGNNACKGKGYIMMNKRECLANKGKAGELIK